jgi:hypothetical protein
MKKEKKSERVIRALSNMGTTEVKSTSRKYRVFALPTDGGDKLYFVGKAGALRTGSCVSKSVSLDIVLSSILAKWAPLDFNTKAVRL